MTYPHVEQCSLTGVNKCCCEVIPLFSARSNSGLYKVNTLDFQTGVYFIYTPLSVLSCGLCNSALSLAGANKCGTVTCYVIQ